MPFTKAAARLLLLLLALSCLGASCGPSALAFMPGVVNNPGNRSLRRALFSYAIDSLCGEAYQRSLPLKLRDADPSVGRFFPSRCAVRQLANGNLFVDFSGHGYAWTNGTGRLGFQAEVAVEYQHDFLMDGASMYVYFQHKQTQRSDLTITMVEKSGSLAGSAVLGGLRGLVKAVSVQQLAQQVGSRLLEGQLRRGFTVVRDGDDEVAFALGLVERGQRPPVPFDPADSKWPLLANDRAEIHQQQRDYAGPFVVKEAGQALYLTLLLEGAPAVDVLLLPQSLGEGWLAAYEASAVPGPPAGPVLLDHPLAAAVSTPGQSPPLWRRTLRVPPGRYYLVFDNTSSAGASTPTQHAGDDRAALVSYAVQVGDAD